MAALDFIVTGGSGWVGGQAPRKAVVFVFHLFFFFAVFGGLGRFGLDFIFNCFRLVLGGFG